MTQRSSTAQPFHNERRLGVATVYHPDPEINAEVAQEALESERLDLAAGYPPRHWWCPECGASHGRGHFMTIGIHRCLGCGYVGDRGVMDTHDNEGRLVA